MIVAPALAAIGVGSEPAVGLAAERRA